MEQEQINTILKGLQLGSQFTAGQDRLRVLDSRRVLQNLVTGRFVSPQAIIPAYAARLIDTTLRAVASEVALILKQSLLYFTGTQYHTLQQLAMMGHPYARRHFTGRFTAGSRPDGLARPPQFVNAQMDRGPSRSLSLNFNVYTARQGNGVYSIMVQNTVPHAGLLVSGTNSAIARPYDRAAVERTRKQSTQVISDASKMLTDAGLPDVKVMMPDINMMLGSVSRQYRS
jgi:hypothetical protein